MTPDFDLFVIGGGSGGVRAARLAARAGKKTAIAEEARWGGTCVNIGCVPKKLFMYAGLFSREIEESKAYGWHYDAPPSFSWPHLIQAKDREIKRLNGIYQKNLEQAGVTLLQGRAVIEAPGRVRIGDKIFSAAHILIVTGGKPVKPDIPGKQWLTVSDDLFQLKELPKSILILGSGYIAVEFACIFNLLGLDVTLAYRKDRILRNFDAETVEHLSTEMAQNGIRLLFETRIASVEKRAEADFCATTTGGAKIYAGQILAAIGRKARLDDAETDPLGATKLGIAQNGRGYITVDENFETNIPSLYALGDVVGRLALTPVAIAEAMVFINRLFGDQTAQINYDNIASAVFSTPILASVGPSEEALRERGITPLIYKSSFRPLKNSLSPRAKRDFIKILVNPDDNRVLSFFMAGDEAAEIIQALAPALQAGISKAELDATMALHPSTAEEFVTLYDSTNEKG